MKLNEIRDNPGATHPRKTQGRGIGSGLGKTGGRGGKGQSARSGFSIGGFEGGQMPLYRRLPKRGFHSLFRRRYVELNLNKLQAGLDAGALKAGEPITEDMLVAAGLVRRKRDGIRLLANGEVKVAITIHVTGASKSAIAAVEKAGGKVVLPPVQEPPKGKGKSRHRKRVHKPEGAPRERDKKAAEAEAKAKKKEQKAQEKADGGAPAQAEAKPQGQPQQAKQQQKKPEAQAQAPKAEKSKEKEKKQPEKKS